MGRADRPRAGRHPDRDREIPAGGEGSGRVGAGDDRRRDVDAADEVLDVPVVRAPPAHECEAVRRVGIVVEAHHVLGGLARRDRLGPGLVRTGGRREDPLPDEVRGVCIADPEVGSPARGHVHPPAVVARDVHLAPADADVVERGGRVVEGVDEDGHGRVVDIEEVGIPRDVPRRRDDVGVAVLHVDRTPGEERRASRRGVPRRDDDRGDGIVHVHEPEVAEGVDDREIDVPRGVLVHPRAADLPRHTERDRGDDRVRADVDHIDPVVAVGCCVDVRVAALCDDAAHGDEVEGGEEGLDVRRVFGGREVVYHQPGSRCQVEHVVRGLGRVDAVRGPSLDRMRPLQRGRVDRMEGVELAVRGGFVDIVAADIGTGGIVAERVVVRQVERARVAGLDHVRVRARAAIGAPEPVLVARDPDVPVVDHHATARVGLRQLVHRGLEEAEGCSRNGRSKDTGVHEYQEEDEIATIHIEHHTESSTCHLPAER